MADKELTRRDRRARAKGEDGYVPDKPTNIAPGGGEYPGKGAAGKDPKADAPVKGNDRTVQGGRDEIGKTGPKGANMKGATQS